MLCSIPEERHFKILIATLEMGQKILNLDFIALQGNNGRYVMRPLSSLRQSCNRLRGQSWISWVWVYRSAASLTGELNRMTTGSLKWRQMNVFGSKVQLFSTIQSHRSPNGPRDFSPKFRFSTILCSFDRMLVLKIQKFFFWSSLGHLIPLYQ